jgi:hypothetical protein
MHRPAASFEPRWPVVLTILTITVLVSTLHNRVKLFPDWFHYTLAVVMMAAIMATPLTNAKPKWVRIERAVVLLFFSLMELGVLVGLARLIREMLNGNEIDGLRLLTSSISVWLTNILMFSLLYWQIDRGSPEARINGHPINGQQFRPDWLFPQAELSDELFRNWQPVYVDYLFLSFTTATAFSPTDALPLTSRAKLLMMLESLISLTTIVVVASRAINILS